MTTSLDHLARGRDNNLNLIRIVAAAMVLVSHSFVIASGNPHAEPWDAVLGRSPGGMAVDIFFVISGFLVSGSLVKQASIGPYLMARAVRIYPGLWVALLLTVLVVGWCATSASPAAFFTDPQTWRYLLRNGTMVLGAEAVLPGAFEAQPFAGVVNGSLWTLRHELRLYLLLALAWWLLQRWAPGRALDRLKWLVTLAAVGLSALALWQLGASDRSDLVRMGGMFFTGAALHAWRQQVQLGGPRGLLMVAVALLAMVAGAAVSPRVFEPVYRLAMPLVVCWMAFVPAGPWRAWNRLGDYSYGVYIYAFPVQQLCLLAWPGLGPWGLTGVAGVITLALAVASWYAVESPALEWLHRRRQRRQAAAAAAAVTVAG
ncbi:MAG: acyltransferase [Burkholderiales bacterium PBB6]|nr:MAG: acyltransferase [Burkholderiales bacterium PBB6]